MAFGDLEGALPPAETAAAAEPRSSQYRLQLARVLGVQSQRAGMFKAMGLAKRFRKEAEEAAALDPKNVDARFALLEFHLVAPGIVGGDRQKADALAEEIFKLDPSRGWLARATVRGREKQKDLAQLEGYYLKAVETDPAAYGARLALAGFYSREDVKKYDLVEKRAREALAIDRGRVGAHATLAFACAKQRRLADLETVLAAAEASVPDNLTPYYTAGRTLVVDGLEPQRAERYLRKYLAQEAEGSSPSLAAARWRLGLALEKQGRKQEAVREIAEAVRLDPAFEPAKKDLARLK
jgi:tetratricopeptide (TPR) repeat protein